MAESQPANKTTQSEKMDTSGEPAPGSAEESAKDGVQVQKKPALPVGHFGPGMTGPDQQFQMFMGPMFSQLESTVKEHEKVLDKINEQMKKDSEERRKAREQEHIPKPLKGRGQKLKDVMKKVGDMIQYEIDDEEEEEKEAKEPELEPFSFTQFLPKPEEDKEEEKKAEEEEEVEDTRTPVPQKQLDDTSHAAVTAHSLAAYISTLREDHLRKFTSKVTSDCQLWLSKMFRFNDASVLYHEEPRDGLVRVCRLALYNKYPKYATEGFEALYSRPPVIYLSSAAKPGLSNYLCLQLGLPMSCICTVPCHTLFGSSSKMDVGILEKLIQDDIAAAKTPVLLVAYAGTPVVGHVDHLEEIQEVCKKRSIWLHLEGSSLATLGLLDVPTDILSARTGDSMTVTMGQWLGIPAIPFATLFKTSDPSLVHAAGLNTFNPYLKLNCLPLWVCLQSLGIEGIVERITGSCDLARLVFNKIEDIKTIKLISKEAKKANDPSIKSIRELISRAITALLVFEMVTPTVVFKYQEDPSESTSMPVATYAVNAGLAEEEESEVATKQAEYYNALNAWLADTLALENPNMDIQAVDVEREGVCIRYAPLESAQVLGTTEEDIEKFAVSLKMQLSILDATVLNHTKFTMIVDGHENLRTVEVSNWAGLGAVQYIPTEYLEKLNNLTAQGRQEINSLNVDLVQSLKSTDMAFSMGYTDDGMACVKFGLITEETDVEELVGMVQSQGKVEEESSRYMETMTELVKKGIEEANKDLVIETQHKIMQEGLMRQVPLVSSLMNWWSPPPKDVMKGRTFNLVSGVIASTEDTYKYHMQVQENASQQSSPRGSKSSPLPKGDNQDTAQLPPQTATPQTKSAGDVKAKLVNSVHSGENDSPQTAIAEGQEASEEHAHDLRLALQNPESQVSRES